jgi:CheY-like chemotaxis protein
LGKSILLVDDTATVLVFEQMMLRGGGYELRTASNGAEALEKVRERQPELLQAMVGRFKLARAVRQKLQRQTSANSGAQLCKTASGNHWPGARETREF